MIDTRLTTLAQQIQNDTQGIAGKYAWTGFGRSTEQEGAVQKEQAKGDELMKKLETLIRQENKLAEVKEKAKQKFSSISGDTIAQMEAGIFDIKRAFDKMQQDAVKRRSANAQDILNLRGIMGGKGVNPYGNFSDLGSISGNKGVTMSMFPKGFQRKRPRKIKDLSEVRSSIEEKSAFDFQTPKTFLSSGQKADTTAF